jgi:hypothetical protein
VLIYNRTRRSNASENLSDPQAAAVERLVSYVAANTGMNEVVPAWRLVEMIKKNPWTEKMAAEEKKLAASDAVAKAGVVLDVAVPPSNDANPNHREDFTSLANAAARKQKQDE